MVELESRGEMSRNQVARFLREFADELEEDGVGSHHEEMAGDRRERATDERRDPLTDERRETMTEEELEHKRITFIVGGNSATVTPPSLVDFDIDVGSRSPLLKSGVHQKIELVLSWDIEEHDAEGDVEHIELE